VRPEAMYYNSLGTRRGSVPYAKSIFIRNMHLTRQPYFHCNFDTMHEVHQSCSENAHIDGDFDTITR